MKVKIGDRSQFYGELSDPAMASRVMITVFDALQKVGLNPTPVYTGIRGIDAWFEIPDELATKLEEFVVSLPEVGTPSRKTDEKMGDYLDLPLIFEKRAPRRRR